MPPNVREVCRTIAAAGHEAVTVGGAVRDALLGREPGDWDVATSARPEDVMKLFRHTIPTGLQHGTVTIVTGRGAHTHVEVTTFRGEGAYSDARRPDHVVFGVPLVEDLARRDLVVNAMAYDPSGDKLVDPFGGREDIDARRLRAVGDAVARFTEDGLRVMRAVRFAAQLEFELDPETEAGIPPALPSLAKVSRERVSDELRKLLATRQPSRGLRIAHRTGILANILRELQIDDVERWATRIDRAPLEVRLAALFVPLRSRAHVIEVAKALKFSNVEADVAGSIVGGMAALDDAAWTPFAARKLFAELGRATATLLLQLWNASEPVPPQKAIGDAVIEDPLAVKDLALTGGELMKELQLAPGPIIGRIIHALHLYMLEDPARNTRDAMILRARELAREFAE